MDQPWVVACERYCVWHEREEPYDERSETRDLSPAPTQSHNHPAQSTFIHSLLLWPGCPSIRPSHSRIVPKQLLHCRGRPNFGFGFGFGAECGQMGTFGGHSVSAETSCTTFSFGVLHLVNSVVAERRVQSLSCGGNECTRRRESLDTVYWLTM